MPTQIGAPEQQRTSGSASNTFSKNLPATGSRRAIVVDVGVFHASACTVTGVTYGGVALTKVGATFGSVSVNGTAERWVLVNPPTGANNVVVSLSTAADECVAVAHGWNDVNQTTPTSAETGNNNTASANPSVTMTVSGSNQGLYFLEYFTGGTDLAVEGGTNLAETTATASASGWSSMYGGSNLGWTLASSAWAACACNLVHDGGGGASQVPRSMHQFRLRRR